MGADNILILLGFRESGRDRKKANKQEGLPKSGLGHLADLKGGLTMHTRDIKNRSPHINRTNNQTSDTTGKARIKFLNYGWRFSDNF